MMEWGPIKVIVHQFMLPFLAFCYDNVYANYGMAIILLTVVIKVAFFPLMTKQYESMKKMQEIKPDLDKINQKFKDQPQKKQQALMTLYKEKKVNPFQGCLPMIVQIPFFLAIYSTILSDSFKELIHAPGVNSGMFSFWLTDLSVPDPTKILPILLAIFTYYSQKMTMVDPQQKMLLIISPIFILIFGLKLPAGVVLYWTVQTVLSAAQQYWIMGKPSGSVSVINTKAKKIKQ